MNNKNIAIVILNYQNYLDTIECIESVSRSSYDNFKIFVVDNASPNHSMAYIQQWAHSKIESLVPDSKDFSFDLRPREIPFTYKMLDTDSPNQKVSIQNTPLLLIQSHINGGYAAGNNIGIRFALEQEEFDYVWLLNNDTIVKEDALQKMVVFANANNVDLLGTPLYDYYTGDLQAYCGHINKFTGRSSYVVDANKIKDDFDYIHGASLLIKTDVFLKIGLLSEEYFLYYEEVDYCFSAQKKNLKMAIAMDAKVFHKESASVGAGNNDIAMLKLTNRLIFYKKYFSNFFGLYVGVACSIIYKIFTGRFALAGKIIQKLITQGTG